MYVRVVGYKYEEKIFEKNGFTCVLENQHNKYDLVFIVGVFEDELPFMQIQFELIKCLEEDDGALLLVSFFY